MSKSVKAAVIDPKGGNPKVREIQLRAPAENEVPIKVLAVGFHRLVVARASGSHYSVQKGDGRLVGVDGVGYVGNTKELAYFTTFGGGDGSYGEVINVNKQNVYPFPKGVDSREAIGRVAGLSNGVMPSYIAFKQRIPQSEKIKTVLILGVTGTAGKLAVQVAKKVGGADRVIGVGRSLDKLRELQAKQPDLDDVIALDQSDDDILKSGLLSEVDLILDFVWSGPAERFLDLLAKAKKTSHSGMYWVQIGSVNGPGKVPVSPSLLRMSNFHLLGTGLGVLGPEDEKELLTQTTKLLAEGYLEGTVKGVPFSEFEETWTQPWDSDSRIYFSLD